MDARNLDSVINEYLRLAKEDLARSSLTSAERHLEQAIATNSNSAEAFYLLGTLYVKKGKFRKATLAFEKVLRLDPNHTEAAIAVSSLYNDLGKYNEGAEVYNRAKVRLDKTLPGFDPRINQGIAEKHFDVGMLYTRYDRFQEAYHEFAKASNLDPHNINYAVQLAKCMGKTGDKESAIRCLRAAVEKNPTHVEARIQLGILLHSVQRLSEAYDQWNEAIRLEPDSKTAQMYLSMFDYEKSAIRPRAFS